jgi:hypothetical protein
MASSVSEKAALLTVLNPQGQPTGAIKALDLAPRLASLEGQTVYLLDIGFGGGFEFLQATEEFLTKKIPSVKTVLKRKPGNMLQDTPEFWADVKANAHAVIFGVGG